MHDAIRSGIEAEFYYYGDNQRAPYGNLPTATIQEYTRQAFDEFERIGVDVAVIACNTVTALCIESLRKTYPFPVVGTEPAVLPAVRSFSEVAVLVTEATFQSERFNRMCAHARERFPDRRLVPVACPMLAGAIERGILGKKKTDYAAYLPKLEGIGERAAVVLGCTHYLFVRQYISDFYRLPVIDGNEGVVRQLKRILENTLSDAAKNAGRESMTTDRPPTTTTAEKGRKSPIFQETVGELEKNVEFLPVVFLGSGHENNKKAYEQMFGY